MVELGELREPAAAVIALVASTIGVHDASARPLLEAVTDYLASRRALLVLDNCEQVIDAVAELAHFLLPKCPELRILATSREPLRIGGEIVVRVPPLTIPDPDHPESMHGVSRFDSVALFAERATTVLPSFDLDENKWVVANICARLDGLPLAIELAAARLRVLSPEQILQRLTDRYALLTQGSRQVPTRQQTLRWCIGWSYDLCSPSEQQLWGRLSVFAGSFELTALEAVCGDGRTKHEVLDDLASLVDRSILIREGSNGEVRFRLLDTLREYGRATIDAADYSVIRRRHLDWYLQLALDAEAVWISPRQLEWSARLQRELPNLREALDFSMSKPETAEDGLQLAATLNRFWRAHGLLSEGRRWLDRVLANSPKRQTLSAVRALCAAGRVAALQGDFRAAITRLEEVRTLDSQLDDPIIRTLADSTEGFIALYEGDLECAAIRLADSAGSWENADNPASHIESLVLLGWAHELNGRPSRAASALAEALAETESRGEFYYRSYALWASGLSLWRNGETARAEDLTKEALRLTQTAGNPLTTSLCLQSLAWIACKDDNPRRAAVLMGAADNLVNLVGRPTVQFPDLAVHQSEFNHLARISLSAATFTTASQEGANMDLDTAIAFALEDPVRAKPSVDSDSPMLTKRELQVARLVSEGFTNKGIATQLVLSPRTVAGHVEHILIKLGFTSRAQIAAWTVEQGSNPAPNKT
ncbi:LuxR C-terminal-related transcriptional regulator [Rhodococcus sp. NPDC127530]|uniref:LuxR C-terminal-related transcriptional regulator n=1 Tax=Rhodococcus sp. NPDC127530 TaxID=3345397 RepID=UPI003628C1BD